MRPKCYYVDPPLHLNQFADIKEIVNKSYCLTDNTENWEI